MERPSQAGVAGGCEIITGGGLVSGRLKAPWWAKGLMLEVRKIVRKLQLVVVGRSTYSSLGRWWGGGWWWRW